MANIDDQQVLDALAENGSDLTKEHSVDFLLYFVDEGSAVEADKKIRKDYPQLIPRIAKAVSSDEWIIEYTTRMVPTLEKLKELRTMFEKTGADYDGWGAEIEK